MSLIPSQGNIFMRNISQNQNHTSDKDHQRQAVPFKNKIKN